MNETRERRHVLTWPGMRYLAACARVADATFARHAGVTRAGLREPSVPGRILRHREHTLGVNRFFARLAKDARRAGWRLAEWRNEAESTRRFVTEDGGTSWIRPDGSGVLVRGAESVPFFLEYDRGTLDAGDYRAKFEGYRRYYAGREWEDDFPSAPLLLFVCADDRAERRVVRALPMGADEWPIWLTTEWRVQDLNGWGEGALGAIWRNWSGERRSLVSTTASAAPPTPPGTRLAV